MNVVDRIIRDLRISQAVQHIWPGSRVLDIGCHDGALFRRVGHGLREGVGLDPTLAGPLEGERYHLEPGFFPKDAPDEEATFDAITMLALLEHIPPDEQPPLAEACHRLLKPGGRLILTVPSPQVDGLLDAMERFGILNGMEAHQHYGFEPSDTVPLMEGAGFRLLVEKRFQFGLNNLYVFERPGG